MARELTYHLGEVVDRQQISPHLVRVVVGGNGLAGWSSTGVPDEAFLLVVPHPETGELIFPDQVADDADPYAYSRWYTVRRYDAERHQVTLDVVVHETGLATRWAQEAAPGDPVAISSTRSWYELPHDATWQLLFGDIASLPAISRIVEQTPADVRTWVAVEIPDPADAQALGADVTWEHNRRLATRGSDLAQMVARAELPEGTGYVYVAGEAAATRDARKNLRRERGLGKESYGVIGYWRVDKEAWMRRFEAAGIDLEQIYADGERAGLDEEQLSDEVDRQLDAAGL